MALSKQIFVCFSPSPHILLPRHNLLLLSHITAEKAVMDSALSPGDCLLGLQQLKE